MGQFNLNVISLGFFSFIILKLFHPYLSHNPGVSLTLVFHTIFTVNGKNHNRFTYSAKIQNSPTSVETRIS